MKKYFLDHLKAENLYSVYYHRDTRTDVLEFIVGDVAIWITGLKKDENTEDYWEIQKNIDKAMENLTSENIHIQLISRA